MTWRSVTAVRSGTSKPVLVTSSAQMLSPIERACWTASVSSARRIGEEALVVGRVRQALEHRQIVHALAEPLPREEDGRAVRFRRVAREHERDRPAELFDLPRQNESLGALFIGLAHARHEDVELHGRDAEAVEEEVQCLRRQRQRLMDALVMGLERVDSLETELGVTSPVQRDRRSGELLPVRIVQRLETDGVSIRLVPANVVAAAYERERHDSLLRFQVARQGWLAYCCDCQKLLRSPRKR